MQLLQLGLNRYLYRDNTELDTTNALASAYKDIGSEQGGATGGSGATATGGGSSQPANSVAAGSVIQSSLLQSSPGDNRVEINPSDNFFAYRDGGIVVRINRNGIFSDEIIARNLEVIDDFIYRGIKMPRVFAGVVASDGTGVILPTGWTSVQNGTGDYTITHNLGSGSYVVVASPITGHFRCQIAVQTANTFQITWQQTNYGSDTFPVTGGGGGNVTVSGVRLTPGEVPIDVGFGFTLVDSQP